MGEFYINTQAITGQSGRLVEVGSSINGVKSKVAGVASGLSSIGLGSLSSALEAIQTKLMMQVNTTDTLSTTLSRIVLKYIAAESEIMGIPFYLNPDYIAAFVTTAENSFGIMQNERDALIGYYSGDYCTYGEADDDGFILWSESDWREDCFSYSYHRSHGWRDVEFSFGPSNDLFDEYHPNEYYYDDDLHNDYVNDYENRRRETVHLIEAGSCRSNSLLHDTVSVAGEYGTLDTTYDVLRLDSQINAWGGLFDKNGNFAPGFGGKIGASLSVLSVKVEGLLGNDYLGVYGKAGVDVGKVSLEAAFSAGLVDADGKWNPSAGVKLNAEAIAAQVNGSAGLRVMGTDIGVSGSVGVGIGAHANIGVIDGKVSVDIGAYLGVGASASFEIDFSDTYDTIVGAYNDVTDYFSNNSPSDMWNDFTDSVSDGWNDFTDTVSDGWNDFTDSVSDGWDSFTGGVSDAWDTATSWLPW